MISQECCTCCHTIPKREYHFALQCLQRSLQPAKTQQARQSVSEATVCSANKLRTPLLFWVGWKRLCAFSLHKSWSYAIQGLNFAEKLGCLKLHEPNLSNPQPEASVAAPTLSNMGTQILLKLSETILVLLAPLRCCVAHTQLQLLELASQAQPCAAHEDNTEETFELAIITIIIIIIIIVTVKTQ